MNAINHAVATASLEAEAFTKAMTNACKVVEKRNAVPVLSYVLISATPKGATITGTDLDIFTSTFVPGQVDDDFSCLVDAHKVLSVLKKAKGSATVNFTSQGDRVVMSIGKLYVTMTPEHQPADFPEESFREKLKQSSCCFVVPSATLAKALQKVSFAISTEETRYYLNGVFMHIHEDRDRLTFVTTDGHRLARYEMPVPSGAGAMRTEGAILPRALIGELSRLLKRKGCPEDVMVTVTDTAVSFLIGEDELLESKLIDGTFPDYQRVMPTHNPHIVEIMPSLLTEAVEQASTITTERGRAVKLTFGDGWLRSSVTDPEFGTAEMQVACANETPLEIGFNSGYLLSILAQIEGRATFAFDGCGSPAVIKDQDDDAVTYVQMPMRV